MKRMAKDSNKISKNPSPLSFLARFRYFCVEENGVRCFVRGVCGSFGYGYVETAETITQKGTRQLNTSAAVLFLCCNLC